MLRLVEQPLHFVGRLLQLGQQMEPRALPAQAAQKKMMCFVRQLLLSARHVVLFGRLSAARVEAVRPVSRELLQFASQNALLVLAEASRDERMELLGGAWGAGAKAGGCFLAAPRRLFKQRALTDRPRVNVPLWGLKKLADLLQFLPLFRMRTIDLGRWAQCRLWVGDGDERGPLRRGERQSHQGENDDDQGTERANIQRVQ
jgi:hypothetical protein